MNPGSGAKLAPADNGSDKVRWADPILFSHVLDETCGAVASPLLELLALRWNAFAQDNPLHLGAGSC